MRIKNEQGYALVTVLLIITLFMAIIISVMGQSFNTTKQNQTVEKNYQSVALAEMGINYYRSLLNNIIPQAEAASTRNILNLDINGNVGNIIDDATIMLRYNTSFCQEFKNRYASITETDFIPVKGDKQYKIKPFQAVCSNSGPITVSVESTGKTGTGTPVTLKADFTIQQVANNTDSNAYKSDPVVPISNILDFKLKGIDDLTTGLTNLLGGVITGNSSLVLSTSAKIENLLDKGSSLLIVQGDAVLKNVGISGNSRLIVFGDVYLKDPLGRINGNAFDVCILGNVYYNNKLQALPEDYNLNNKCSQGHWGIDPVNGVNVDYSYRPTP